MATHSPSAMTFGEAQIERQEQCDGSCKEIILVHKQRMDRKEAIKYYNNKIRPYWLSQLDQKIPVNKREMVLNYLLGKTKE